MQLLRTQRRGSYLLLKLQRHQRMQYAHVTKGLGARIAPSPALVMTMVLCALAMANVIQKESVFVPQGLLVLVAKQGAQGLQKHPPLPVMKMATVPSILRLEERSARAMRASWALHAS